MRCDSSETLRIAAPPCSGQSGVHETARSLGVADVIELPASVPASLYTRAYYLTECGGHEEFHASRGRVLPGRIALALELAAVREGERVLDVGAGRGEASRAAASRGARAWALDYSLDASLLSRELARPGFVPLLAGAACLPFASGSFDAVLMLDVVEHLHPHELSRALAEARRVLTPSGRLVVHTAPNLWYYALGYPLYRAFMRLRGERLPEDPRDRLPIAHSLHVNEQSPSSLKAALARSGFSARVLVRNPERYARERSRLVRLAMRVAAGMAPLKYVFSNDIFAVAWKGAGRPR